MALIDEDQGKTASGGRSAVLKEEKLFFRNRARIPIRRAKESENKKEKELTGRMRRFGFLWFGVELYWILNKEEAPSGLFLFGFACSAVLRFLEGERRTRKKSTDSASPVSSASAACVMERAKEIQSSLLPELPSFIKLMLPSHVAGGFWLGLLKVFCDLHLPKQDSAIFLEDDDGKAYETKFLSEKVGLSAGWRGFSIAHGLLEGDVLVFQLVKPRHWKVFISRVDNLNEVDSALSLLQLFPSCKEPKKRKHGQTGGKSSLEMSRETPLEEEAPPGKDGPDDGNLASEILDGIRLCEFVVRFEDVVKQPEDFVVAVDGLVVGGELLSHLRNKYYELCLSKGRFLHDNLVKGLNCKLVVGIISETVNIAVAITASKVTTSAEDFAVWEKTLRAFQDLGMDVGFLLTRLGRLMNLAAV